MAVEIRSKQNIYMCENVMMKLAMNNYYALTEKEVMKLGRGGHRPALRRASPREGPHVLQVSGP